MPDTGLTIVTLNMWNINEPFSARMDIIGRYARAHAPHVFCFQEVPVVAGKPKIPQSLKEMGYRLIYLATGYYDEREEGLAVCTRLEPTFIAGVPLPDGAHDRGRSVLAVRITEKESGNAFFVLTTHLAYNLAASATRQAQAKAMSELISTIWARLGRLPTLVMGDFNSTFDEGTVDAMSPSSWGVKFRDVQSEMGLANRYTLDRRNPYTSTHPRGDRRIDYMLASDEWQVEDFRIILDGSDEFGVASDHYGLSMTAHFK